MREPVLLFDAECGLCNAVVRFLLKQDRAGVLRYAPLQGAFGQAQLRRLGLPLRDFDSIVFLPGGEEGAGLLRTAGVFAVLEALGGGWARVARAARSLPAAWSDLGYKLVARTRHMVFGRHRPRPAANLAWEDRFLP